MEPKIRNWDNWAFLIRMVSSLSYCFDVIICYIKNIGCLFLKKNTTELAQSVLIENFIWNIIWNIIVAFQLYQMITCDVWCVFQTNFEVLTIWLWWTNCWKMNNIRLKDTNLISSGHFPAVTKSSKVAPDIFKSPHFPRSNLST